jgi:hypothetical protein
MNYKVINYYLAFAPTCYKKQENIHALPKEIVRYIFSYINKSIMIKLNDKKIQEMYINNCKNHRLQYRPDRSPYINETIFFHPFEKIPYPKIITVQEIVEKIIELSKQNDGLLIFSHLCCLNKGCAFKTWT